MVKSKIHMKWTNIGEIHMKWTDIGDKKHSLRNITNNDLKVPEKPRLKCMGFTYNGAKLFNMLPLQIRETLRYLQNYVKRLDKEKHSSSFSYYCPLISL